MTGFQEAFVGAGIQPGNTASQPFHHQFSPAQIFQVDIGYFQFSTS